eukprot:scaffold5801_cov242-Prasinococcus_capsulatus_cf.AAC.2
MPELHPAVGPLHITAQGGPTWGGQVHDYKRSDDYTWKNARDVVLQVRPPRPARVTCPLVRDDDGVAGTAAARARRLAVHQGPGGGAEAEQAGGGGAGARQGPRGAAQAGAVHRRCRRALLLLLLRRRARA